MEITVYYVERDRNVSLNSKDIKNVLQTFTEVRPAVERYRNLYQRNDNTVFNLSITIYDPDLHPDAAWKVLETEFAKQVSKTQIINVCLVKTHYETADFWLVRSHSSDGIGRPTKEYKGDYIGVKIREDKKHVMNSDFLFYWFQNAFNQGHMKELATGSTNLQHLPVSAVNFLTIEGFGKT
tara:strand:- start:2052 stop:2594 length:543 start_codon:yes stop_codon:yes gene_type:complete